jgi:hypothetical protein
MARVEDESDWRRQVLVGLVVLVAVGAVVGGIVAVITIKAADLAGIDDTGANTGLHPRPRGGGAGPSSGETSSTSSPTSPTSPTASAPTTSSTGPTAPTETAGNGRFTLSASPLAVAASERIDLDGRCPALPSGTVLQVQRKEGGQWTDFPVTATCSGGTYSTYILTGHSGLNRFRMLALGSDETSNTVRVQVS